MKQKELPLLVICRAMGISAADVKSHQSNVQQKHVHMQVQIQMSIHIYIYIHLHMYIIYIYIHTHVHTYIYIHTHIYTHKPSKHVQICFLTKVTGQRRQELTSVAGWSWSDLQTQRDQGVMCCHGVLLNHPFLNVCSVINHPVLGVSF